ncbi:O-antigen ligase [uncultured Hoeflea sp.]|uniref:O-antigen ligase family protein n=1 Tax=uncultured Hoeflea sp. TaxID=538666 RepID=UPI0026332131|nr:O-antigen ligase [uncultured Hoeflea sp.]
MRHALTPPLAAPANRGNARPVLQPTLWFWRPGLLNPNALRLTRLMISGLGLALMLISLRPFAAESPFDPASGDSGDKLNQFGFLAAGAISLLALMCLANRQALKSLLTPGFVLLLLVLGYHYLKTPDPDALLRALILTLIGMLIAFTVIVLPESETDLATALLLGGGAALALSYSGLVLSPDLAKHGYDAYEPQHSGLWRGHFSHKNIAGPVMCVIAIFGIYLMRSGRRLAGFTMFAAAAVFVMQTGSKTTAGFFPVAVLIVSLAPLFGRAGFAIFATFAAMIGVAVLTLGTLYSQEIAHLVGDVLGDDTYTGRTTLWEFSLLKIPEEPWLGYGLHNFWMSENVLGLDKPFEAAWDYRNIVHGHNNYLDIILNLGVIGGGVLFWVLFIAPMVNYARARRKPGNRRLADMFFTIIVFLSLLSFIETFFLARNDPIWLIHALAVFGLHLLARFRISDPLPRSL